MLRLDERLSNHLQVHKGRGKVYKCILSSGGIRTKLSRTGEKLKIQMQRCMWLQTGLGLEQEKHH